MVSFVSCTKAGCHNRVRKYIITGGIPACFLYALRAVIYKAGQNAPDSEQSAKSLL